MNDIKKDNLKELNLAYMQDVLDKFNNAHAAPLMTIGVDMHGRVIFTADGNKGFRKDKMIEILFSIIKSLRQTHSAEHSKKS